jgi:hypothetical protein
MKVNCVFPELINTCEKLYITEVLEVLATNVVKQGTVHQIVQAIKFLCMPDESPSTSRLFLGSPDT